MSRTISPLERPWVPELSRFLESGFALPVGHRELVSPPVLEWKYFDPRGFGLGPRSFVVRQDEQILAHVGLCTTAFVNPAAQDAPVSALHMIEWLTGQVEGPLGAMLMLRTFARAQVQYALGCSPAARRVLLGTGFQEVQNVGLYHRVLRRRRPGVWRELHGQQVSGRRLALFLFDFLRSFLPGASPTISLEARRVTQFGPEVLEILQRCALPIQFTARSPELLNHYLRHPGGNISGWILSDKNRPRGFAVLSVVDKQIVRGGRIMDLFLDSDEIALWVAALQRVKEVLSRSGCDLISSYGSTPWFEQALRQSGFFRRGRSIFYLRDPQKRLDRTLPFHLTHLEGDIGYA